MKNEALVAEIKTLTKILKREDLRSVLVNVDSYRLTLVDVLAARLEKAPQGMTHKEKRARFVLKALLNPIKDMLGRAEDSDLDKSDLSDYHESISNALTNFKAWVEEDAIPDEDPETKAVTIFEQSHKDAVEDKRIFHRTQSKVQMKISRVKRSVVVSFSMGISDSEAARTSLKKFRIQDGYAVIPNQKILVTEPSTFPKGSDMYDVVVEWANENLSDGSHVIEKASPSENGLVYFWILQREDYEVIFENRTTTT